MKYTVEITEDRFVETLEIENKIYQKSWERSSSGVQSADDDFYEQLEADGFTDEEFLNEVYDKIDESFFAYDLLEVAELN